MSMRSSGQPGIFRLGLFSSTCSLMFFYHLEHETDMSMRSSGQTGIFDFSVGRVH